MSENIFASEQNLELIHAASVIPECNRTRRADGVSLIEDSNEQLCKSPHPNKITPVC
jgi:hypothetical protein